MTAELEGIAKEKGIKLAKQSVNNVLTYALFPQVGLKFLQNRGNPDAFEPAPGSEQLVSVLLGFWPIFSRQIWYYQPLKGPSRC